MPNIAMVLIALTAFMFHEFEEIALIKPWIRRNSSNFHLSSHPFMGFENTSTSTISLLIAEEFLLFSILSIVAIVFEEYSFILSFYCIYTFHLLVHILEIFIYKCYCPSFVTAILTLPVYLWVVYSFISTNSFQWQIVLICFVISLAIIGMNFKFINWLRAQINKWLNLYANGGHKNEQL
jgi:hypothetical protein